MCSCLISFVPSSWIFFFLPSRSMPTHIPAIVPASMPALVPAPMLALVTIPVSCPESPAVLSSRCMPAPSASAALSSLCHALVSHCRISALLSPLPIVGPSLAFRSSPIRIFKQSMPDKAWPCVSISSAKPFCLFSALGAYNPDNNDGLYNLTNINKYKWGFDTTFNNSCQFASNHDQEEVNLSFVGYGCPNGVKFNQSWELNLLNPKPVCIIEAMPFTAALRPHFCALPPLHYETSIQTRLEDNQN